MCPLDFYRILNKAHLPTLLDWPFPDGITCQSYPCSQLVVGWRKPEQKTKSSPLSRLSSIRGQIRSVAPPSFYCQYHLCYYQVTSNQTLYNLHEILQRVGRGLKVLPLGYHKKFRFRVQGIWYDLLAFRTIQIFNSRNLTKF